MAFIENESFTDKIYNEDEINNFINEAIRIEISNERFKAISLGTKAFWGSSTLVKKFQELEKQISTIDDLNKLKDLIKERQSGEDEMANQVLLWYETIPKNERINYGKNCAIWAKICAELKLARGYERYERYALHSNYLKK